MIPTVLTIAVLAWGSSVAEVSGDIREGETYIAEAAIELQCGADTVRGKTDKSGSFRLTTKATGKCALSVIHKGNTASIDVVVFDKPSKYRLVLEMKDGVYILKRV